MQRASQGTDGGGDAGRGTRRPVLLVHGQPGVGADWSPVTSLLRADHQVLAPDRPGYGANTAPVTSMAANAEFLAGILRTAGATPAVVVGHSYGGGIALLLAAGHPELVAGLVLVASVGGAGSVTAVDRVLAAPVVGSAAMLAGVFTIGRVLPEVRRRAGVLPEPWRWWAETHLPDDRYGQAPLRALWRVVSTEQRALVAEIGDIQAAAREVAVPATVVTGTRDPIVPPGAAVHLAAAIRGAELVTVARTGHFVPRDRPDVVARAVRRLTRRSS